MLFLEECFIISWRRYTTKNGILSKADTRLLRESSFNSLVMLREKTISIQYGKVSVAVSIRYGRKFEKTRELWKSKSKQASTTILMWLKWHCGAGAQAVGNRSWFVDLHGASWAFQQVPVPILEIWHDDQWTHRASQNIYGWVNG